MKKYLSMLVVVSLLALAGCGDEEENQSASGGQESGSTGGSSDGSDGSVDGSTGGGSTGGSNGGSTSGAKSSLSGQFERISKAVDARKKIVVVLGRSNDSGEPAVLDSVYKGSLSVNTELVYLNTKPTTLSADKDPIHLEWDGVDMSFFDHFKENTVDEIFVDHDFAGYGLTVANQLMPKLSKILADQGALFTEIPDEIFVKDETLTDTEYSFYSFSSNSVKIGVGTDLASLTVQERAGILDEFFPALASHAKKTWGFSELTNPNGRAFGRGTYLFKPFPLVSKARTVDREFFVLAK